MIYAFPKKNKRPIGSGASDPPVSAHTESDSKLRPSHRLGTPAAQEDSDVGVLPVRRSRADAHPLCGYPEAI
jgi:hypothetical protein